MKKFVYVGWFGLWVFLMVGQIAFAQTEKEEVLKKQAQAEVAADSDQYVIGPEDILYIHIWREEALSRTVPVRMDGNISLPIIQEIKAAGLTPLKLKEGLTERLKEFIESPNVSVTVMEANSFKVYISGEVKQPGVQNVRRELTLVKLIIMAGGFTEWANQKKILIIRKEKGAEKRITVNYTKIIEGEEPDVVIKSGDTIIVR